EREEPEPRDVHALAGPVGPEPDLRDRRPRRRDVIRIEDVAEAVPEQRGARLVRPGGDRLMIPHGEGAQVVDPVGVVRVPVGVPDRVDRGDPGAQELEPELGRRVDEEAARAVVALHDRRVPGPAVARIRGGARRARAPDDGDPERGPGPEEAEPQTSSTRSMFVVPLTWNG